MYRAPPNLPPLVITAFCGRVIALRVDTGVEEWRHQLGGLLVRMEVTSDRVIAVCGATLVILEYATGRVLGWIELEGTATALLVVGSLAFVSQSGTMVCVDLEGGRELWRNALPGTGFGAAAIGMPGITVQADVG